MASKSVHHEQATHNEKLANELIEGDYYDWACTSAFYAALHYVEAKFTEIPEIEHTDELYEKTRSLRMREDTQIGLHLFREECVGVQFPKIRRQYRNLREVSDQVRYLVGMDKSACEFLRREVAEKLINEDLMKVKQGVGF